MRIKWDKACKVSYIYGTCVICHDDDGDHVEKSLSGLYIRPQSSLPLIDYFLKLINDTT